VVVVIQDLLYQVEQEILLKPIPIKELPEVMVVDRLQMEQAVVEVLQHQVDQLIQVHVDQEMVEQVYLIQF
tara:strand:- start:270 stop:482 length:213 start_codon:yes stop_codon:yes gene_type:complete